MNMATEKANQTQAEMAEAIRAWNRGAKLTHRQRDLVDFALLTNSAEQAVLSGFTSDRFESHAIEVGA